MTNFKINLITFFLIFSSLMVLKFYRPITASIKQFLYSPVDSYLSANIKSVDGPARIEVLHRQLPPVLKNNFYTYKAYP